jgi:hypothetical protein
MIRTLTRTVSRNSTTQRDVTEFLTPRPVLLEELPGRLDFAKLYRISERWVWRCAASSTEAKNSG